MKGWVYVITNKAMPGLVKVGYSTKDPELRAGELNHTGSPHPYLVEYDLLIDEPYQVEQKTHRLLSSKREAKEWFRCSPEEAVAAIKQIAGNGTITETYKRAERAKAEALHQQELQKRDAQLKQQQIDQEIEALISAEQSAIHQKYQQQFDIRFPPKPFWVYWLGGSILALIGISMIIPKDPEVGAFVMSGIVGAIIGTFLQNHFEKQTKESVEYISLERQRDAAIASISNKKPISTRRNITEKQGDEEEVVRCTHSELESHQRTLALLSKNKNFFCSNCSKIHQSQTCPTCGGG